MDTVCVGEALIPLSASRDPERVLIWQGDQPVTQGTIFAQAEVLAGELPDKRYALNLCNGRHTFLVGMMAAILRGQLVVLPNDRSERFAELLTRDLPDHYAMADDGRSDYPAQTLDLRGRMGDRTPVREVPMVPAERDAIMVFTSGSTGEPQPHIKALAPFEFVARASSDRFNLAGLEGGTIVATVPSQHMYGMETTVALPLWSPLGVHADKPFYPSDIAAALAQVPAPRVLVTTPVHMRTLLASEAKLPPIHMTISATAPLSQQAAQSFEQRFETEIYEIFGFSEAGTVATRRTVLESSWLTCEGLTLHRTSSGSEVRGAHLPQPMPLNDVVELQDSRRFELLGRTSDNINIAGKRTSLAGLNALLNGIEGVVDGAFFQPEESEGKGTARLIVFVVAPDLSSQRIGRELRRSVDPVFLPRRIFHVPSLPRSETGKLTRAALAELAGQMDTGRKR